MIQEDRFCTVHVPENAIHISSSSTTAPGACGTKVQPWTLEALTGQRINIGLLDFSGTSHVTDDVTQPCPLYGYIVDRSAKKNISICGGGSEREETFYVSHGNSALLVLTHRSEYSRFLIRVQGAVLSLKQ